MNLTRLYITIVVILTCVENSILVQYIPPNRIIEAVENERYEFGIEDDGELEIARCTGISDTGIKHSFLVRPTFLSEIAYDSNVSSYIRENIVTDRGAEGLCIIVVGNVQSYGPKKWHLIAQDYDKNVIAETTFTVEFFHGGPVLKYEIRMMEFASFVNYLNFPPTVKLVSCYLKINETIKIDIDMKSTRISNIFISSYSERAEDLTKNVSSLGFGYCGLKYIYATMAIRHMHWSLTATDNKGLSYRGTFVTRVDPKTTQNNLHITLSVLIGSKHVVNCLFPNISPFCSIFNPKGELVEISRCSYIIPSFAMEHIGIWKCYIGAINNMESLMYTIDLRAQFPEKLVSWVNETRDYFSVGCGIENYRGSIVSYCKLVRPDEQIFNLIPYFATSRYLAIGTDFIKGMCHLMIRKPLQNSEIGLWKCEIKLEYRTLSGTYFTIGSSKPINYPKYLKVTTRLGEPFSIKCNVPYQSGYCQIRAPNGTLLLPGNVREVGLGRCHVHVEKSISSENGTWTCMFGRKTGMHDEKIVVVIAEVLSYYKAIEADVGDTTQLMCTTGGLAIEYCRYISPSGVGYYIENHATSTSGISYYGKGFEYGECGIQISNVQSDDAGYWTCVTKLVIDDKIGGKELSAQTMVDVAVSGLTGSNIAALSIGTAVGIIIVTGILAYLAKQKWNRQRHFEIGGLTDSVIQRQNSITTTDSNESNIFSLEDLPRFQREPRLFVTTSDDELPTNNNGKELSTFSNVAASSRSESNNYEACEHSL